MNFLRALTASLLSFICSLAVIAFVILTTLQTTILDRNEAKTWIQNSGVYQTALTTAIDSDPVVQQQIENTPIPPETLKTALNKTLPTSYVQSSGEKVIENTYDWLDGQTATISFEIDATSKRDYFVANLTELLEPQIAALPRCGSIAEFNASNPTCVPPGYTAKQLASSLATDAANTTSIFRQPLTSDNLTEAQQDSQMDLGATTKAQKLPGIVSAIRTWIWLLPAIAILSGGLMVLLSRHKLVAAKHLAGKLTVSLVLAVILGIAGAMLGPSLQISDYIGNNSVLKDIFEPILHQALPAIGVRLAWISGISALVTGGLWITLRIIKKHSERAALLRPPTPSSDTSPPSPPKQINTSS